MISLVFWCFPGRILYFRLTSRPVSFWPPGKFPPKKDPIGIVRSFWERLVVPFLSKKTAPNPMVPPPLTSLLKEVPPRWLVSENHGRSIGGNLHFYSHLWIFEQISRRKSDAVVLNFADRSSPCPGLWIPCNFLGLLVETSSPFLWQFPPLVQQLLSLLDYEV